MGVEVDSSRQNSINRDSGYAEFKRGKKCYEDSPKGAGVGQEIKQEKVS